MAQRSPDKLARRHRRREKVELSSFFNLGTRWGGWLSPPPGRFTPRNDPVLIEQEAGGGGPGPVWTGAENLAPTGISSPDCLARSEALY
jgi:hypothetical protein